MSVLATTLSVLTEQRLGRLLASKSAGSIGFQAHPRSSKIHRSGFTSILHRQHDGLTVQCITAGIPVHWGCASPAETFDPLQTRGWKTLQLWAVQVARIRHLFQEQMTKYWRNCSCQRSQQPVWTSQRWRRPQGSYRLHLVWCEQ